MTEIQPSQWQLPEEWPPSSRPHQTPSFLALSNRQPSIRLPIFWHPLLPPGPLQPEPKPWRIQTRGRCTGSHTFIQRIHHSHPRPQAGGGFHWRAIRTPCKVQRGWKRCCRCVPNAGVARKMRMYLVNKSSVFSTTHPLIQMLSWDNSSIMEADMETCFYSIYKQQPSKGSFKDQINVWLYKIQIYLHI